MPVSWIGTVRGSKKGTSILYNVQSMIRKRNITPTEPQHLVSTPELMQ